LAKRRSKRRNKRVRKNRLRRALVAASLLGVAAVALYAAFLGFTVVREFDQRGWDVPARVYAAPLELYAGRRLSFDDVVIELARLGYRESASEPLPIGTYRRGRGGLTVHQRGFTDADSTEPPRIFEIGFDGERIEQLADPGGAPLALARLDPLLIGSVFPAHGEDRIVLTPEQIPPLLIDALKAVEDRRFDSHYGLDVRAILRAALVNLTAGEIRQGASTLTQQLVRSYFLTNDRTWRRKLREAVMAFALELRYDKRELLHAYVNEIYLGQDGARAIHGFGLASRFYFGKPLGELELHELALLIAQVRGPSYYEPRRHPERALARRNLVLEQMHANGIIGDGAYTAARERQLAVLTAANRRSSYYAAFLDLVRRQLRTDYADDDLQRTGLSVFTTLDPAVQSSSETALIGEIERLQPGRPELDGAVIVTTPHNAEVRAVVGGRRTGLSGFNRALDAHRQVGSLIKPVVYLAALESGRHSMASIVDDAPIDVPLDNGNVWSPRNFDETDVGQGPVTAVRALSESLNMATVRLGLDVGLEPIAELLGRLGLERVPRPYPSLLLGAFELSPLEVTQIYNTLANGGFRIPLRSVRAVVDSRGQTLQRFPLQMAQASDPGVVYALNQALVEVMTRGTGRMAQARLPAGLTMAGKTGTSDGLRDSWFAGFGSEHLVVTWIGNDANAPIGLTGSTGASLVWSRIVADTGGAGFAPVAPGDVDTDWIDYRTGLQTDVDCPEAVATALGDAERPPKAARCGSDEIRIGSRIRRWLQKALH
jgi:penicillin-binding protein 1B